MNDHHDNHDLKRKLKRGPRLSRQLRAEFALSLIGGQPRKLKPETLVKLEKELVCLGQTGDRRAKEFVEKMFKNYPELRSA